MADGVSLGAILLAEDNPADAGLIRLALREHGVAHTVLVMRDGEAAMSWLQERLEQRSELLPALILLDLNLPKHDGWDILRYIRSDDGLKNIPVVIVTSSDSPLDRATARELCPTHYLRKPSSLDEFLAIGGVIKECISEPHKDM